MVEGEEKREREEREFTRIEVIDAHLDIVNDASQEEWRWGPWAVPRDEWLAQMEKMINDEDAGDELFVIVHGDAELPDAIALTGNGLTSEKNARYISKFQPRKMREFLWRLRDLERWAAAAKSLITARSLLESIRNPAGHIWHGGPTTVKAPCTGECKDIRRFFGDDVEEDEA